MKSLKMIMANAVLKFFDIQGYSLRRDLSKLDENIHFLHIGKCAGTQTKNLCHQINSISNSRKIFLHGHNVFLEHLNVDAKYFFGIREPISRYRSGFYSVKRLGRPDSKSVHTIYDRFAFETFPDANDLAEALFEPGAIGEKAFAAMKSIGHTGQNQCDWFVRRGGFLELTPPLWIIRQEHFLEDFERFLTEIDIGIRIENLKVAPDAASAHRFNYDSISPLSEKAIENLRRWYVQDFEFYRACETWMNSRM